MNFDFTQDQHDIKRTARDLLTARSTLEKVREAGEARKYDDALWRELCELGWPGIAIDEAHGGQGLGVVELMILSEELGYALASTPFLGSALAGVAIQAGGDDAQRERWLPGLASGEKRGALGAVGSLVADAPGADVVVVVDGDGRWTLVEGGAVEAVEAIDPTRGYGRVDAPGSEALEGPIGDRPLVAISAELVGVCQRALEMTVAYVKDRKQFDTPVGAFQAVSHRAAQMLVLTEGARSATYYAGWAADADPERLPEAASMAKAAASDAGREVTAAAIQSHGGIGFTWEADVHWFYKRAQVDATLLGGAAAHRKRLARIVGERLAPATA
jgi:alkylation response protein AidB-like acyl-CoA dehydrogenase